MKPSQVAQRRAHASLDLLGSFGYTRSGNIAHKQDDLIRAISIVKAPQYSNDVVTFDVTFHIGLPGLSVLDKAGLTWSFDTTRAHVDGDRSLRRFEEAAEGQNFSQLLADDIAIGRQYLERWASPDDVIAEISSGGDGPVGPPRAKGLAVASAWAAFRSDQRLGILLKRLRRESPSDVFLDEYLQAIEDIGKGGADCEGSGRN